MLQLLRKIRSKSLKNSKLLQYSLYAIGEVALVIIGILIAVNLNNSNEARKERKEINKLLVQVQSDLANNLFVIADHNIKYSAKDTLVNSFLKSFSENQVPSNEQAYAAWQALMRYNTFELQNEGYKALMLKAEFIPEEYSGIVNNLNYLYKQLQGLIKGDLTTANEQIEEFRLSSGKSASWYLDLTYNGQESDEFLDFLVKDLSFRNMLVSDFYSSGVLDSRTNAFYQYALKTYREIDDVLSAYDPLPKKKPFFKYEISRFDQLLGKYYNTSTPDTFDIIESDSILYINREVDSIRYEIYPFSKRNMSITSSIGYIDIVYENDSTVDRLRLHRGTRDFIYKKLQKE